jgi:hypothetical protein
MHTAASSRSILNSGVIIKGNGRFGGGLSAACMVGRPDRRGWLLLAAWLHPLHSSYY